MDFFSVTGKGNGYLENRSTMLKDCPQMVSEKRFYHLGIDIVAPSKTALLSPSDGEVVISDYESGKGNYGGFCVIKNKDFYVLFGHLDPKTIVPQGAKIKKGQKIAELGDRSCNGDWFEHVHVQILTPLAFKSGWVHKGYCTAADLPKIDKLCPNPQNVISLDLLGL